MNQEGHVYTIFNRRYISTTKDLRHCDNLIELEMAINHWPTFYDGSLGSSLRRPVP